MFYLLEDMIKRILDYIKSLSDNDILFLHLVQVCLALVQMR